MNHSLKFNEVGRPCDFPATSGWVRIFKNEFPKPEIGKDKLVEFVQ